MAALTILEASKKNPGTVFEQGVVEIYAGSSGILENIQFRDIDGNAHAYNRAEKYPGVGFRGVNQSYTPTVGVINPQVEKLVIAGGEVDVDRFIERTMGSGARVDEEFAQIEALSLAWTKTFIKGDSEASSLEFDGLQRRITGDQKIAAGATAGGTALSLAKLDEAMDQTKKPTHLIMNLGMRRRLTTASRNSAIGGHVEFFEDTLGKQQTKYNGLPIITLDLDNNGDKILPFTEAATSGSATGASIYIVSFDPKGVLGLQNGSIEVENLGILQSAPKFRTRIEWFNGFAIYNGRAATRIWSIADAAVTA